MMFESLRWSWRLCTWFWTTTSAPGFVMWHWTLWNACCSLGWCPAWRKFGGRVRTKKMRPLKRDQVKDPSSLKGLLLVQLVGLGHLRLVELEMEKKKEVVEEVEVAEVEVMEVVEEEEGHMRRMKRTKKRFVFLPPLYNFRCTLKSVKIEYACVCNCPSVLLWFSLGVLLRKHD